jgi:hypothetical protein
MHLTIANFAADPASAENKPKEKTVSASHQNQHARRVRYPTGLTFAIFLAARNQCAYNQSA